AVEVDCCPAANGPTLSALLAIPLPLVMAAVLASAVTPPPGSHATVCPPMGVPLLSTRACVVQFTMAPAATDKVGVSAVSTGGVPPLKCACTLTPLLNEATTTEMAVSTAVTFMVATPSPVAVTVQVGSPQARAAVPLITV